MKCISILYYPRTLNWPVLAVCLFAAGCYLSPSISISKIFIMSIGGLFLLTFKAKRTAEIAKQQVLLICFLLFTVLSCLWGDLSSLIYAFKSSFMTLLFVLFICRYKEEIRKNLNFVFLSISMSAGVLSIILLFMHFSLHGIDIDMRMHKFYGPIIQTIKTASVLSVALIIIVWNIFYKDSWQRWLSIVFLIPVILAILLLKSRGATLSLGVGLAVLYFVNNVSTKNALLLLGKSLSILLVLFMSGLWFFLNYDQKELSDSFRFIIWKSSIYQVYTHNIVFGIGYAKDQEITALDGQVYDHSHNIFVSLIRIGGLISLFLFCSYLFVILKHFFKKYSQKKEQSLLLAWLAMSLSTLFFNGSYPVYFKPDILLLIWMPLALLQIY